MSSPNCRHGGKRSTPSPRSGPRGSARRSAVNPKNLLLVVGATTAIAQTGANAASQVIALLVFIILAIFGVGAPFAIYYLMGERATKILSELRDWMTRENSTIMAGIFLIIGAKLIGDAISALAG